MSHHRSWLNGSRSLVGDASFWINIVATGRAEFILNSLRANVVITTTALTELGSGREKGRLTSAVVAELIEGNLVRGVGLGANEEAVFLDLVAGPTGLTLDDGEAATIAFALSSDSVALIDERKATGLCRERYPALDVMSTTDLLLAEPTALALQPDGLAECLFMALSVARMRVPHQHLAKVCELLGDERRSQCRSLPAVWRQKQMPPMARSQR